jgi:O-antigen/teichoic acid export membrane protein
MHAFEERSFIRNGTVASLAIQLVNVVLTYTVTAMLVRVLSPSEFGTYTYVIAVAAVLMLPAQFGAPSLLMREVAAARSCLDFSCLRGALIRAYQFSLIMSAIIISSAGLCFVIGPMSLKTDLAFATAIPLITLAPLAGLNAALIRALSRVWLAQLPEQILKPMIVIGLTGGLMLAYHSFASELAVAIFVTASAVSSLVGLCVAFWVLPKEVKNTVASYRTRDWVTSLIPMGLSNSLSLMNAQIGILALGMMTSTADVALYRVASQTALLVGIVYGALNAVVAPMLAATNARGDRVALQQLSSITSRFGLFTTLLTSALLAAIGPKILVLFFGSEYGAAYGLMLTLAFTHVVTAAFGSASSLLNMTGWERDVSSSFVAAVLVNLLLTVGLTLVLGAYGAAVAAVGSAIVLNIALWLRARTRLGIETGFWAIRSRRRVPDATA